MPRLDAAAERGRAAAPDAVALRLDAFPDKLSKSHKLLEAMLEPRFIALPGAAAALDALHAAVQATLLDALLAKVWGRCVSGVWGGSVKGLGLRGLGLQPEWGFQRSKAIGKES